MNLEQFELTYPELWNTACIWFTVWGIQPDQATPLLVAAALQKETRFNMFSGERKHTENEKKQILYIARVLATSFINDSLK